MRQPPLFVELGYKALRSVCGVIYRRPHRNTLIESRGSVGSTRTLWSPWTSHSFLLHSFFFFFVFVFFLVSPQPSRPWLRRTGGRHCFTQQVNVLRHLSVLQHLCYVRADSIRNRVRCFLLLFFLFLFPFFFRTVGDHRRRNLCSHR